jgi:hypothetical protein
MTDYKYRLDPERFSGLLIYLNEGPPEGEEDIQAKLLECTELLLAAKSRYGKMGFHETVKFHWGIRRLIEPIIDGAKIKIRPFQRTLGRNGEKLAVMRPDRPLLIFEPEYVDYFYEFLQIASNLDNVARFGRCPPQCNRFFLARKKGTKFCCIAHATEFHSKQPDRRRKNTEAVKRLRKRRTGEQRVPVLRKFLTDNLSPRRKPNWPSLMAFWNDSWCGRKRTWKFKDLEEFERECKRVQRMAVQRSRS